MPVEVLYFALEYNTAEHSSRGVRSAISESPTRTITLLWQDMEAPKPRLGTVDRDSRFFFFFFFCFFLFFFLFF
jgi:hypothetical protein